MIIAKQGIKAFRFSIATNSVNLSKNYYQILQVDKSCDKKIIKNSYLKLVKTLHPDVNPNGKEMFTEVQQAYEILSDNELKKYYDQNNHYKNGKSQSKTSESYPYNTTTGTSQTGQTRKSNSGHQYYTHRTYESENPSDYFYTYSEPKHQQKTNSKTKKSTQGYDSQDETFNRNYNPNKEEKYANSKKAWDFYQQQKQQQQEKTYQHQTPQQRRLRDKLKAMRGFTSPYNVTWARQHLRPNDLMTGNRRKEKEDQLKRMMPEKVRKFYDKVMDKLEKIAMKDY